MIVNVTREMDAHLWQVRVTQDDGSPLLHKNSSASVGSSACARGVVWDHVGALIADYSDGAPVHVVYRDDNNMRARVDRAHTKTFTLDLPHRVWTWIGWRNVGNSMLTCVHTEAEVVYPGSPNSERGKVVLHHGAVHRMVFPAVPGARQALDRLFELVDGVRAARRDDPADVAACQTATERLGALYRELRAPWCDTCKGSAVLQGHSGRWAHASLDGEKYPHDVPESLDTTGHEVTVWEWSNA